MDKKLTLSLTKEVIEKAKEYATTLETSLSRMVESSFKSPTLKESEKIRMTPLVDTSMWGR